MDDKKQKLIEKIQKILIHAKDQEGTPEGETFKRQAALLMAKYRINETEIDLEQDNFVLDTFNFYKDNGTYPDWPGTIVSIMCYAFDCKFVYRNYEDFREFEIIGTFHDVETVLYFVEVVCNHIDKEAHETWTNKRFHKKRNQLGNVATNVIWVRLYEIKQQMDTTIHEDVNSKALVVKKIKQVEDALHELYPIMDRHKNKKIDVPTDAKTINAGKKAGETAPLNFAIEGENDVN